MLGGGRDRRLIGSPLKHWNIKFAGYDNYFQGRGFNAGVSLLHLERMRRANWTEMWTREAKGLFRKRIVHKGNDQVEADIQIHRMYEGSESRSEMVID